MYKHSAALIRGFAIQIQKKIGINLNKKIVIFKCIKIIPLSNYLVLLRQILEYLLPKLNKITKLWFKKNHCKSTNFATLLKTERLKSHISSGKVNYHEEFTISYLQGFCLRLR